MKRIGVIAAVVLAFGVSNIPAQTNNPADAPKAPAAEKKKDPATDPGVRKLSRGERKEKMKALSDKYRQWLEEVEPIILPTEVDTFLILETDAQRDTYITEFWRRRDAMRGTTNFAFKDDYYQRIEEAREEFKQLSNDRSRMLLINGRPDGRIRIDCDRLLQPIELWLYEYLPALGHKVYLVFYIPRYGRDYKLWNTQGDSRMNLADLVSTEVAGATAGPDGGVTKVFDESASPYVYVSKIETECPNGDVLMRAIFQMQQNKTDLPHVWDPPQINQEDVRKILRSVVLANPSAPKLAADWAVQYPAKQGGRTDAQMTVMVPRAQLKTNKVGETELYSIDVTGEVLKDEAMFENYRYRFDFPADVKDDKLPVVIDRFLRPNSYRSRIKVTDVNSGAEIVLENPLEVPEIFDTAEQIKARESGQQTVAQLKDAITSTETRLRIVPFPDELLSGIQHIETMAVGDEIKSVEFYLDGRKVMVKRQPPYTLDLDFGDVPQVRKIRAVALGDKGQFLTGDEVVVNTGTDPFRVRINSPRVAYKLHGKTRVEMSVNVPDGKKLEYVQLFLNDTPIAKLYDPPFIQTVNIPETEGVGYLRAVAQLKDDPTPPVEDVVMINTPDYMAEIDVHLVELPTTVLVGGKPKQDLPQSAFKVLDEGKEIKIAKFEYVKNLPLSIGLAIDTSGSMQPRMSEAQKAGAQFFQNVMRGGDKAFLVAFDTQPSLVQKWSASLADMNAGLAKLRAEESTAFYDAVVFSLYNFLGIKGQKALVVITDGKDTASKFSFEQAIEYARRTAVPIYGIGIGIRPTEIDVKYKLNKFAAETGGNTYYIERADELQRVYNDIQNELRSQYVLGFYPPEGVKSGGKWREITVQVSEGKAKTIRGYYP
jgi:Ca-activated chloride channel family protein